MPIKLNLKAALASLLNRREDVAEAESEPSSIVLLLQSADFPNLKQLSISAEKAFNVPFATENATNYCVFQKVLFTMMHIGPHVLSFMYYTRPYFQDELDFVRNLPLPSQREACEKHTAYLAMNYAKGTGSEDIQYALLSRLTMEILDSNCTGGYIPGKGILIPNDENLSRVLESRIAKAGALKLPPLKLD